MTWRRIGIRLGKELNELDGLESQYRHIPTQWCRVMSDWLDNGGTDDYPATWKGLFALLRDVDKCEVARELEDALFSVALTKISPSHLLWPNLSRPFLRPHPFLLMKLPVSPKTRHDIDGASQSIAAARHIHGGASVQHTQQ